MKTLINFSEFKKFFLYCMIGALIISAAVGVITVLGGGAGDLTVRVFMTLFTVFAHSLLCLIFIWDDERRHTFENLSFFSNVIFLMLVVSFIGSVFGIWQIIDVETVGKLYVSFFYFGFAALHADILAKAMHKEKYIDSVINANFVFIVLVVAMIQPTIYLDNPETLLGGMYYRLLAAAGIIDGTLSILTIIFYKLYVQKHPEMQKATTSSGSPVRHFRFGCWLWVLVIYLAFQFGGAILWMIAGTAWRGAMMKNGMM